MNRIASLVLFLIASAACSSTPEPAPTEVETPALQKKGLPAQNLAPGDCGLFLWNRTDASTFLFFQRSGEGLALFYENGEVEITNTANDGTLFGQFYSLSHWSFPDGRSLRLSIEPGEEIDGGQRISNGVISATNSDGWEVKTPVAGVTACSVE